ncbi:protein NATD1-like [Pollicipes pollicipes]|uniref:protein NATD1-like n=1 Tax=Pollicipes pollicipes TaxID=41117 RepID=UPI0018850908|nr:protein NATD1-like [Pollicipes pollicipes]
MLTRAAARSGRAVVRPSASVAASSRHQTASAAGQPLSVQHDTVDRELFIELPGSDEKAYLQYEHVSEDVLDLQHTVVPKSFRGRGVAKLLAKAAFDYVILEDKKMKLTCWYLQKYLKDDPSTEYARRLVE